MKKRVIFGSLGIIAILVAITLFLFFLMSLDAGANFFYFIGAILFTSLMIYSFIQANKPDIPKHTVIEPHGQGMNNLLEQNNAMIREFNTTERNKEHLRMLEQAGSMVKE